MNEVHMSFSDLLIYAFNAHQYHAFNCNALRPELVEDDSLCPLEILLQMVLHMLRCSVLTIDLVSPACARSCWESFAVHACTRGLSQSHPTSADF